jgi:Tfp pilus assembly protein PilF
MYSLYSAAMRKTLALTMALVGTLALACAPGSQTTRKAAVPREYAAKQLNTANKALKAKDLAGARKALIELESSTKANAFEKALALQLLGYTASLESKHSEAIAYYEQALAANALPPDQLDTTEYNLGQLYVATKRYDDAIRVLESRAQRMGRATPEGDMALANAYWGKRDAAHALPLARSAVANRADAPESWLRLLATLYLDQKQYAAGAEVLDKGIADGRVEPSAKMLDLLASAWFKAGRPDEAEAALRRAAAGSADGRADLRLGHLLVERKKWGDAIVALNGAIAKGGLEKPADAQLLLGIARFESGDLPAARVALQAAAADPDTRKEAREWLAEVDARAGKRAR